MVGKNPKQPLSHTVIPYPIPISKSEYLSEIQNAPQQHCSLALSLSLRDLHPLHRRLPNHHLGMYQLAGIKLYTDGCQCESNGKAGFGLVVSSVIIEEYGSWASVGNLIAIRVWIRSFGASTEG